MKFDVNFERTLLKTLAPKVQGLVHVLQEIVKGGPIARSKSLKIHLMVSFDREGRGKSVGTGLTVKLGLVWQTEALECPKNSFTEIAILTN